jgi:hypothetical protein
MNRLQVFGRSSPSRVNRPRRRPRLEPLEARQLLSSYLVTNTGDNGGIDPLPHAGTGTLRQAIVDANSDVKGGVMSPDNIYFAIPASTAPNFDVPVPGFDPDTQDWTITLQAALPTIINTVWIDGYTQAHVGVPFRYPAQESSTVQSLSISGSPTGGFITLSTVAPLPAGTTSPIPYNANEAAVQAALEGVVGAGNVTVSGGPLPGSAMTIQFGGIYVGRPLPTLIGANSLTGGTNPSLTIQTLTVGGLPTGNPDYITSVPNQIAALNGNNARARVIVNGQKAAGWTGFALDGSHSLLRGLIISNFTVGVSVPALDSSGNPVVGTLIQGNFIGDYFVYPVDPTTGQPLTAPNNVGFVTGQGNAQQGVVLASSNTTVGGSNPQENNVICGNGAQGIWIQPGASGNQVLGNQIGLAGPSDNRLYSADGNGADGVLIQSSGTLTKPLDIVYASSNYVGPGNLISANHSDGVHLVGVGANRNLIQGNYIGVGPGGGYLFGTGDPGNRGDGVRIEDGSLNEIGGGTGLGNTIDSNHGAGVYITGVAADPSAGTPATGTENTVSYNMIGVTAAGSQILGNDMDGVSVYSPSNTIGPGNVISGNLRGLGVYGPGASPAGVATATLVIDNFIGCDGAGTLGFGNAIEGVRIDNSAGNTIQGNSTGSQVISGNQDGIVIIGSDAAANLVLGNLIGSDRTGHLDLGNRNVGVLIENAPANTIGGSSATSRNLISANHWGVQFNGAGAIDNVLEGNYIGTDLSGTNPLGNEVYGVVFTNLASQNTVGGTSAGLGNRIAFHRGAGVDVVSGSGNSILSNSIWANAHLGIDLVAKGDPASGVTPNALGNRIGPNDLQNYPILTSVTSNGLITHVVGSLSSLPSSTFLIQFFVNPTADPSGYGQGQFIFGSTQVTTDAQGNATIDLQLASAYPAGDVLSATATNITAGAATYGDTSEFCQDIPLAPAFQFTTALYVTSESSGKAVITVSRNLAKSAASVTAATVVGGTATPGSDYIPVTTVLNFPAGSATQTFNIPILDPHVLGGFVTVNLALSNPSPTPGNAVDFQPIAVLRINRNDSGSSGQFVVTNTNDAGAGSLRQAILNADLSPVPSTILFDIPAATDPLLADPVSGFDPSTKTWTISLLSPLPPITQTVAIDGYTQAHSGVPFRYPAQVSSAVQTIALTGVLSGGTFTLSTAAPLPLGTTAPIAFDASPAQVQAALSALHDASGNSLAGNVSVTGSAGFYTITFQGQFASMAIPNLIGNASGLVGAFPGIQIGTLVQGGVATGDPILISSVPNTIAAKNGNNAQVRVIVDGSKTGRRTGFEIDASHCVLSGLIIDGFGVGVSVPNPTYVGNLIRGNFIGNYLLYPVNPQSGAPLTGASSIELAGAGNAAEGVYLDAHNTTIGGTNPQENNVIAGNLGQGIWIDSAATGNVVEGNQIGMVGPSTNGLYYQAGNGAQGVLVHGSSNVIGGSGDTTGNVISGNGGDGVEILGPGATETVLGANLIGLAPGGGYRFGTGNPGNGGNGVLIINTAANRIGGPDSSWANTISSNSGDGILVTGVSSTGNAILNNLIGLTAAGSAVKGNLQDGIVIQSAQNTIGPGNVIAGNFTGVNVSGSAATGTVITDNLIRTDLTGEFDLGNASEGILIQDAGNVLVKGNAKGSQVISGNQRGIVITGATASQNLVTGNLIGTDKSGMHAIPNADEGIAILGAPGNTIGGTSTTAANLISGNEWGVRLDGALSTSNLVEGNLIGTDITGKAPLGNEVNGVVFATNASNNTIGGTLTRAGNTIAFNALAGVSVSSGTGDSILTNSIYSNGKLGIDLVGPNDPASGVTPDAPGIRTGPNNLQNHPILTGAVAGGTSSSISGSLNSIPNLTFLIQFFTSTTPDPSGFGQGQTPFGSLSVTTDGNGNANISYTPSSGLAPNLWVTATATNIQCGDTSEFSNAISAQPVSVEFLTSAVLVNATAGVAIIHVERMGNASAVAAVNYSTTDGTALAGKDYRSASGTLVFLAGVTDQTFTVTILPNPSQTANSATAYLTLSKPAGGATLGSPSTATLTINNNMPPTVQFFASTYTTYFTFSSATVTVTRGGGSRTTSVQVNYATAGGTAAAGVDYTPVSGTLTFLPNQTTATFTVPILHHGPTNVTRTVGLALSNPTGGGQLGPFSKATLNITAAQPVNPVGPPPQVIGEQLVLGPTGITAVVFSFSEPLNPTAAADLGNYGYYALSAGPDRNFGTADDGATPLIAAQYNAAALTVTLIPAAPLPYNAFERITIDALANPLLGRGLTSTSGVLLSGLSNGIPGSPFVTTFGLGTSLTYADGLGKTVYVSLAGGGLIEMFRTPSGDVQSTTLVGAIPRKSVLTLHANSAGGRYTYFPPIQGAAGVRFRYRTPPIVFQSKPVVLAKAAPKAKPVARRTR